MGRYAQGTTVSVDSSILELKATLRRYEADAFYQSETTEGAIIGWRMCGRMLKLDIPYPSARDMAVTERGVRRTEKQMQFAAQAEIRRRWRAAVLYVKAQLEWAREGVMDFDSAMMPLLLLPNGQSMREWGGAEIRAIYEGGRMPALPAWDGR
jgi:hypothetical protein